jgi:hypothetical protein
MPSAATIRRGSRFGRLTTAAGSSSSSRHASTSLGRSAAALRRRAHRRKRAGQLPGSRQLPHRRPLVRHRGTAPRPGPAAGRPDQPHRSAIQIGIGRWSCAMSDPVRDTLPPGGPQKIESESLALRAWPRGARAPSACRSFRSVRQSPGCRAGVPEAQAPSSGGPRSRGERDGPRQIEAIVKWGVQREGAYSPERHLLPELPLGGSVQPLRAKCAHDTKAIA